MKNWEENNRYLYSRYIHRTIDGKNIPYTELKR